MLKLAKIKEEKNEITEKGEILEENDDQKFEKVYQKGALILLITRFYYYHNQINEAREYVKQFDTLCDSLGNFFLLKK